MTVKVNGRSFKDDFARSKKKNYSDIPELFRFLFRNENFHFRPTRRSCNTTCLLTDGEPLLLCYAHHFLCFAQVSLIYYIVECVGV